MFLIMRIRNQYRSETKEVYPFKSMVTQLPSNPRQENWSSKSNLQRPGFLTWLHYLLAWWPLDFI